MPDRQAGQRCAGEGGFDPVRVVSHDESISTHRCDALGGPGGAGAFTSRGSPGGAASCRSRHRSRPRPRNRRRGMRWRSSARRGSCRSHRRRRSRRHGVLARRARLAEEAGFESLWVGDHIALPAGEGNPPRLEAMVALTYLAAVTSRVRLGVGLIVLPQRQPVLLAKQVSSLDVLSGGRLTVAVGAGYVEPELHAMGVSLAERGARTDEYLAAMRALWEEAPSFDGRFVSFSGVVQHPSPVQRPHPPIVVGGHSAAAYRRAVRHGNGWYGWGLDPGETGQTLRVLGETARAERRPADLGELEITITPPGPPDLDTVRRYADVGVDRLIIELEGIDDDAVDGVIESVGEIAGHGVS
ncbi:LLM class F420-dependent oxidoreductase [Actinoplanes hulinensis]|uniref:LLM class F420-dependent oxidoreductase n=1 Tax=Actinoplanes hulinensis TaxID=1144547 RepID=UPI0027E279E1|nr:LLM class F420-dependent oxidoreductase [Actinoplanes hulinensis]